MKRLLFVLFTAAALSGASVLAPIAAQALPGPGGGFCAVAMPGSACVTDDFQSGTCRGGRCDAISTEVGAGTVLAPSASPTSPASGDVPIPSPGDSSAQFGPVMSWMMTLFAWLVGVASVTLDNAVYYTVITMGTYIHNLSAIGTVWSIMRDIGNIALIFGFMVAGIATILNYDLYGWSSKMLPTLLLGAVLLNFSLFISEAVIDTGNLFATQFYTQINGGQPAGAKNFDITSVTNDGISNKIMAQLGLQSIYGEAIRNGEILKVSNSWVVGFLGIILFLVTACVLFTLAFILIARFGILLYIIITSPIGFAGWIIPSLSGPAKKWWSQLIGQTITAPILFLLLYIALRVITDARFLTGFCTLPSGVCEQDWTGFVSGNTTGFASMVLSFLVAMALLLIVIMVAKSMSAFGANLATKLGGMASFGAAAYGASGVWNTLGWSGRKFAQRVAPDSRASKILTRYAFRPMENARVDVRRLPGVSKGLSDLGAKEAAAPMGQPVKPIGQFKAWREKSNKEAAKQYEKETRLPRILSQLETAAQAGDSREVGRVLGTMSGPDLENAQNLLTQYPLIAAVLPQNRFDDLMKSDNLSNAEKDTLRTARRADPRFANAASATANLAGMTIDQRSQLDGAVLTQTHVLPLLDAADFNAIARRGALNQAQRAAMGAYIAAAIAPGAAPTPATPRLVALAANPQFRAFYNLP